MTAYLIRRIFTSLIVVLGVSIFIFFLLHLIYPSPAQDILGAKATHAAVLDWNRQHGFERPWVEQYLTYMNHLIHGDLGYSYKVNQSVAALFGQRWARSAYLSGISLLLAVVIAIPIGIYQAVKRNTVGDNIVTSLAFTTYAMPVFFLALILIQVFALSFPIFSFEASQSLSLWHVMLDWHSMTLPIATLTLHLGGRLLPVHAVDLDRHAGPGLHQGCAGPRACPSGLFSSGTCCAMLPCRW